jgi:hypothetical protein
MKIIHMSDPTGLRPPGFLEINVEGDSVEVFHQARDGNDWTTVRLFEEDTFFVSLAAARPYV